MVISEMNPKNEWHLRSSRRMVIDDKNSECLNLDGGLIRSLRDIVLIVNNPYEMNKTVAEPNDEVGKCAWRTKYRKRRYVKTPGRVRNALLDGANSQHNRRP